MYVRCNTNGALMQLVSFRIDDLSLQGLDMLAKEGQTTRSQLICKAVRDYLGEHLYDNRVIKMNAEAFDEFLDSFDEPLSAEEREGRERLAKIQYPWSSKS